LKVLFLTNNDITAPLADWLRDQAGVEVVLYSEKLAAQYIEGLSPDMVISYNYRYIISEDVINSMNHRIINLHISMLPYNRGAHPNLWSFLNNTPKGVTIHLVDKGIDTGDILLQKEVCLDEQRETLETSYKHLHNEIQQLFIDNWDDIRCFRVPSKKQPKEGSANSQKESVKIIEAFGDEVFTTPIYRLKEKLKELCLI